MSIFTLIDDLAPPALHQAIWQLCWRPRWRFGHQSVAGGAGVPFWVMDLDGEPLVDELWALARPRCEAVAGLPLRVYRQYANGHTYGLGGQTHTDDLRPGTHTLLYYPMVTWPPAWEGETVFYDPQGALIGVVQPRPNRALIFDARIPHQGRPPSRVCGTLRVTLAFKLEPSAGSAAPPRSPVADAAPG